MDFDGTQILIGRGAQAEVFRYQGFAYKVYKPTYPEEWISFEKQQQKTVNQVGLCPVRYYDTDDPHIIKMDLIDGEELEKRVRTGYLEGFNILASAHRKVHAAKAAGIRMPRLTDTAYMGVTDEEKNKMVPLIEHLFDVYPSCICHLDLHFLNIMLPKKDDRPCANEIDTYTIIDWMNARIAPAIFDYARTYVIFDEFAKEALSLFQDAVASDMKELGITDSDFADAVEVCSIIRKHEK